MNIVEELIVAAAWDLVLNGPRLAWSVNAPLVLALAKVLEWDADALVRLSRLTRAASSET